MSITISYHLTEEDYFEYHLFTSWTAPWNKKKRMAAILRYLLFGAVFVPALVYTAEKRFDVVRILIYFAVYVLSLFILIKYKFRRTARKIYNDPRNAALFSEVELTFTENGFSGRHESSSSEHKWSAVTRNAATDKHFFLYTSEFTALVIPKRIFKSVTEKESFEKLLAQYVPLHVNLPTTGE